MELELNKKKSQNILLSHIFLQVLMFSTFMCIYVCRLVPYCDTSDETDALSLETMLSSISNKR